MKDERADRLQDWFDIQLSLVDVLTSTCGVPFERAATLYTNLHRRFGFGRPSDNAPSEEWKSFVTKLARLETRAQRVEWTRTFGRNRLISDVPSDRPEYGCFNIGDPNNEGVVRIHFASKDNAGGTGPLSREKVGKRRRELADMFADVRQTHGGSAQVVAGASWLYNLAAYQRLFPESFAESRKVYKSPTMTIAGMPFWGQFLDHEENIKSELRDQFLANLQNIEMDALWRLFPMPVMITRAPIAVFYDYYSV